MESKDWMKTKFCDKLQKWLEHNIDLHSEVDEEVLKKWPIVISQAQKFDTIKEKFESYEKSWFATNEGCIFMTEMASQAASTAQTLSSLISLIAVKMIQKEKDMDNALKPDGDAPEEQEEPPRAYQGQQMDPDYTLGRTQIHLLMMEDLDDWGPDKWIYKVFNNMMGARSYSYGLYELFGADVSDGENFTIQVDCFIKNLKPDESPFYCDDYVKGTGATRVIAAAEAIMLGNWKVAHSQLENVLDLQLEAWSFKFFVDEDWDSPDEDEPEDSN